MERTGSKHFYKLVLTAALGVSQKTPSGIHKHFGGLTRCVSLNPKECLTVLTFFFVGQEEGTTQTGVRAPHFTSGGNSKWRATAPEDRGYHRNNISPATNDARFATTMAAMSRHFHLPTNVANKTHSATGAKVSAMGR